MWISSGGHFEIQYGGHKVRISSGAISENVRNNVHLCQIWCLYHKMHNRFATLLHYTLSVKFYKRPVNNYHAIGSRVLFSSLMFIIDCTVLFFSERELTFTFANCYRPSVCRLSSVCNGRAPYSGGCKISAIFLRHFIPWPSLDIYVKFYGDRPRGTPPSGELNTRGVVKYSDFGLYLGNGAR